MQKVLQIFLVYVLIPLVIIPLLAIKTGNYFGLFGIACFYIGLIVVKYRQWIFFPIPLFFCFWYWYTYGFVLNDYVTIYFGWLMCGIGVYLLKLLYDRYVHSVLPETEENLAYNEKLERMEKMIAQYQREHPDEKITQELIDKIKTEVFFR